MPNNHSIIESPEYALDAEALLGSQHLINMYLALPDDVKQALVSDEHVPGLVGAANSEWHRRHEAAPQANVGVPKFLGSVERALRLVAKIDLGTD